MIVFGVSDTRPRTIVGTKAFPQPEQTRLKLRDRLHIAVDFDLWNEGRTDRVLAFRAAARPVGTPVQLDGVAWWRDGESLVPMPQDVLCSIYAESDRDCGEEGAKMATLSQVLPFLNHNQILRLLWSLRDEGRIQMNGKRRYACWRLTQ